MINFLIILEIQKIIGNNKLIFRIDTYLILIKNHIFNFLIINKL